MLIWALLSTKKYRNKETIFLCIFLISLAANNLYYFFSDFGGTTLFGKEMMLTMSLTTLIIISAYGYIMLLLNKLDHLLRYKFLLIVPIVLQTVVNAFVLFGLLSNVSWLRPIHEFILPVLLIQEVASIVLSLLLGFRILLLIKYKKPLLTD